jgi:2-phospho-L-lactate guanylyltransferase (CobY/MobA/RfbA family)
VNALALAEVNGFVPRFGVPATTTVAAARAAGLAPTVVDEPALALDVDRPEDYELLLASA